MPKRKSSRSDNADEARASRRKFLKNAGVAGLAGTAAVVGMSVSPVSLPVLTATQGASQNAQENALYAVDTTNVAPLEDSYTPVTRYYYLYATDGLINVPVDFQNLTDLWSHREVYIFGFAKPLSDTRPLGSTTSLSLDPAAPDFAFKDINLIDPDSNLPIMTGKAQLPASPIWGVRGDILEITLFNLGFRYRPDLTDPHTVHLHGVHAPTYYDGIPDLSFGVPVWMGETLDTVDKVKMHSFTYKMYCERPGTYMYHCHVEASEHVQMGMYGSLWVYPSQLGTRLVNGVQSGGRAYGSPLTSFDQEAILLLSEIDTRWHDALLTAGDFNAVEYRPDWWLVNGRAFPDTVLPGKYTQGYQPGTATTADSLLTYYPSVIIDGVTYVVPRQPVQTYVQTGVDQKVLVRLINMGYQAQPMHFHGAMPSVVGKDTFAWAPTGTPMFSTPSNQIKMVFTQGIFSGETYDLIVAYPNKALVSPAVYGFIDNVPPAPNDFSTFATYWADIVNAVDPSIPITPVPSSEDPTQTANGFFSGYPLLYLWHVHDDYKVTNNGVYPGGATTLVKVNKKKPPPTPSIVFSLIP